MVLKLSVLISCLYLSSAVLATPETVLWFQQPGTSLTDSLMVGNGRLGASVWGNSASDNIALNEDTIWSGGPYDPVHANANAALQTARSQISAGNWAEAETTFNNGCLGNPNSQTNFQTAGALTITTNHAASNISNYRRQLDVSTNLVTTSYVYSGVTYTREVLASAPDQVIVVRLNTTVAGSLYFTAGLKTPQSVINTTATASSVILNAHNSAEGPRASAMTFQTRMQLIIDGGTAVASGTTGITVSQANSATLIIAIASSFNNYNDGSGANPTTRNSATFSKLTATDYPTVRSRHIASYSSFFNRFSIDLGNNAQLSALPTDQRVARNMSTFDPGLVSLFVNFGRALLIGSSQPGAVQPTNLQGLWQDSLTATWQSKFTVNINQEMNYWPAEVTGLADVVEPLTRLMEDVSVTGRETAQKLWGATSAAQSSGSPPWVLHHNTDQWRATWPIDGAQYGTWPTGGAWELQTLWEHYQFDPSNTTFVQRIYPLFAGASQFFLETLQTYVNNTQWLVTNPSMSPEKGHPGGTVCAGPTLDNTLLRDLFDQTAFFANLLGVDSAFVSKVQAARARLPPFIIGSAGQLQEWLIDWDSTPSVFSHISPMYGVFPGAQIDPRTTANLASAAKVLLGFRGDGQQGWPIAWRVGVWARLLDAEHTAQELRLLLSDMGVYRGLLGKNLIFQIDANLGGTGAIIEMFIQSQNGEIKLLPALPTELATGNIKGIRARGGYTINISWSNGKLTSAVITANVASAKSMNVRLGSGNTVVALQLGNGQSRTFTPSDFGQ